MDLARAIAPGSKIEITGFRPGEKLHEVLISEDEARTTVELEDMFVVMPAMSLPIRSVPLGRDWEACGKPLPDGFRFASNTNPQWLTIEQIQDIIAPIEEAYEQGARESGGFEG
jgi:UDP-N-acetylglucosamine 4,6-dehydratase